MSREFWINIIVTIALSIIAIIISVITAILVGRWQLLKEIGLGSETELGKKIVEAYTKVRDLELSTKTVELYDAEEVFKEKGANIDFFGNTELYYPAFMSSEKQFFEFVDSVGNARENYEKYLNYTTAAYLYYIERYCFKMGLYIGDSGINIEFLGTILIEDICNWQQNFEKELVKKINHPDYKVCSKAGVKWDNAKQNMIQELWEPSKLRELIDNEENLD